jgi:hypothetical protein
MDFIDFLSKFALTKNDGTAKDMIYTVHNFIQSIPDSFAWLREKAAQLAYTQESFEKSPAYREIRGEIKRNLSLAEDCFLRAGEILEEHGLTGLASKWRLEMETLEALNEIFEELSFDEFGRLISGVKFQTYTAPKEEK